MNQPIGGHYVWANYMLDPSFTALRRTLLHDGPKLVLMMYVILADQVQSPWKDPVVGTVNFITVVGTANLITVVGTVNSKTEIRVTEAVYMKCDSGQI